MTTGGHVTMTMMERLNMRLGGGIVNIVQTRLFGVALMILVIGLHLLKIRTKPDSLSKPRSIMIQSPLQELHLVSITIGTQILMAWDSAFGFPSLPAIDATLTIRP